MTQQNEFVAFLARLCLVLIFPFSALNKIFDYQAAMEQAAHGWIPLPRVACSAIAGARRHARGRWSYLYPAQFLSSPSSVAVHILRCCHGSSVPQFLELSIQRRRVESKFLAIPQKLRSRRRFSLHCDRRQDAVSPRCLFAETVVIGLFSGGALSRSSLDHSPGRYRTWVENAVRRGDAGAEMRLGRVSDRGLLRKAEGCR